MLEADLETGEILLDLLDEGQMPGKLFQTLSGSTRGKRSSGSPRYPRSEHRPD
jgi:hypothetical protein